MLDQYNGVARTKRQECDWFEREVLPLTPMLDRFLERHWKRSSDILDLRQEVLIRVYEVGLVAIPTSTRAFLFQIARNLIIDRSRRAAVRSVEMAFDLEKLMVASQEATPEHAAGARQEFELFRAAFARLSPRIQEAILLRRVDGFSQREAAQRMGLGEKAVERYLSIGLRYLAQMLRGTTIPTGRYGAGPLQTDQIMPQVISQQSVSLAA